MRFFFSKEKKKLEPFRGSQADESGGTDICCDVPTHSMTRRRAPSLPAAFSPAGDRRGACVHLGENHLQYNQAKDNLPCPKGIMQAQS